MTQQPFEIVIGLEVHVQLLTAAKLFCRCPARFGDDPNMNCCPVCLGLPGALPVMNQEAIRLATKTGIALNCRIAEFTKWDRKQYFYPDLPKGYQISQYDLPIAASGYLDISDAKGAFAPKRIRIRRAHLEEDAGKSMHDEQAHQSDSRVDLNRAGTPLLEIVTEPDLSSPEEARAFLRELKLLLTYIRVSDCNMQEGSLRVDANINLHVDKQGGKTTATPIVEVKNMNSFRAVERALAFEVERQWQHWQQTGEASDTVPKQTRGWIDTSGITVAMRTKEESSDYRYFPDPDLVPVLQSAESVVPLRRELGELPASLRQRFERDYELGAYDADVLVNLGPEAARYFEQVARVSGDGKAASNWLQRDVARWLKEGTGRTLAEYPVSAESLGELIVAINSGALDSTRAVDVLAAMCDSDLAVRDAMTSLGVQSLSDAELQSLCRELLEANPKIVQDVQAGKEKALGALIGQARQKNPNVNPNQLRDICLRLIRRASNS